MRTLLFALLLSLPIAVQAQPPASTTPAAAAEQLFAAFLQGLTQLDVDRVVNLFSSDAQFWGTSRKFLSTDTAGIREYFAALSGGQPGQNVATAVEQHVVVLSDQSAALSGIWQVQTQAGGNVTLLRVSLVVVQQDGMWKIAQFHNSSMPQ